MTIYATRLASSVDTAVRMRFTDLMSLAPGASPLTAAGGFRPDGGAVVTVNAGAMTVNVAPFMAWVPGGVSTAQGGYPFVSDANVALTIANGHATLARVDTIAARVRDNAFDASGSTDADVVVVTGTPGAGAPTLPTNCLPIRNVNVPANLSVGTGGLSSGNLGTDRRTYLADLNSPNEVACNRLFATTYGQTLASTYSVVSDATERTALQKTFTKRRADTKLIVTASCTAAPGAVVLYLGMRINGTDVDICRINAGGGQVTLTGSAEVTGQAAGSFTVEPVFKIPSGTATGTMTNSTHGVSYSVREVPA